MPAKKTAAKKTTVRRTSATKRVSPARTRTTRATTQEADLSFDSLWEDELTTQYPSIKRNSLLSLIVLGLGTLLVIA